MTKATRELTSNGREDYVYISRCSACHKTFYDDQINFCPMCGVALHPDRDDSKRKYREPKWHQRARSLGIDPEAAESAAIERARSMPVHIEFAVGVT